MSVMGIPWRLRRIGDLFGRHQDRLRADASRVAGNKSGNVMRRRVLQVQTCGFAPLRRSRTCPPDRYWKCPCPERRPARPGSVRQTAAANAAADATKDNQRKTDEFVEASQAINGPAGNPECVWLGRRVVRLMWLRRSRHRLSSPRSLRSVRLSRRSRPGDVSLPDPVWRADRRQGGREPQRPHSCVLDQSGRAAAGGGCGDHLRAPTAGTAAAAPATPPPAHLSRRPATRRRNNRRGRRNDRKFLRFAIIRALKTPRRHTSC